MDLYLYDTEKWQNFVDKNYLRNVGNTGLTTFPIKLNK